jgi:hypothetical protein
MTNVSVMVGGGGGRKRTLKRRVRVLDILF